MAGAATPMMVCRMARFAARGGAMGASAAGAPWAAVATLGRGFSPAFNLDAASRGSWAFSGGALAGAATPMIVSRTARGARRCGGGAGLDDEELDGACANGKALTDALVGAEGPDAAGIRGLTSGGGSVPLFEDTCAKTFAGRPATLRLWLEADRSATACEDMPRAGSVPSLGNALGLGRDALLLATLELGTGARAGRLCSAPPRAGEGAACPRVPSTTMGVEQCLQAILTRRPRTFSSATAYLVPHPGHATFMIS